MKYKVEYWERISFNEKDVFWEEVEANSEEEAINIVNDRRNIMRKHTKVLSGNSIIDGASKQCYIEQFHNLEREEFKQRLEEKVKSMPSNIKKKLLEKDNPQTKEEFKKYSGRDCDVVLPWGETLKDFNKRMNPNEEIYFYVDQERGYSEYVMVEDDVRFKHPETGEWIEAVFYENGTGKYVRERKDFYNKFKKK